MNEQTAIRDILSAVSLTAGTMIGVGLLAVPVTLGLSGFLPGAVLITGVVIAMWLAGYVLAERAMDLQRHDADVASIYAVDLGQWTRFVTLPVYLLMFYAVLVAYLTAAASSLSSLIQWEWTSWQWTLLVFCMASCFMLFGQTIMLRLNSLVVTSMVTAFLVLLWFSLGSIQHENLTHRNWIMASLALPMLCAAFTYHNVVPLVCKKLAFQRRQVHLSLTIGLGVALAMTLTWFFVVVGTLPLDTGPHSLMVAAGQGVPATVPLAQFIDSGLVTICGLVFSLFAVLTSYLGVGAALSSFLRDIIPFLRPPDRGALLFLAVFAPPLIIALAYPSIFLKMVDLVGGVGTIVLFGLLPVLGFIRHRSGDSKILIWVMYLLFLIFIAVFVIELGKLAGIL